MTLPRDPRPWRCDPVLRVTLPPVTHDPSGLTLKWTTSGLLLKGRPLNSRPDATCLWITPLRSRCMVRARRSLSIFVPPTGLRSPSSVATWGFTGQQPTLENRAWPGTGLPTQVPGHLGPRGS